MGGRIVNINTARRQFLIQTDEADDVKQYLITAPYRTEFSIIRIVAGDEMAQSSDSDIEDSAVPVEMSPAPSSFEALHEGMFVAVEFGERLDPDAATSLSAQRVAIIEHQ